jgi:hypothetical protein
MDMVISLSIITLLLIIIFTALLARQENLKGSAKYIPFKLAFLLGAVMHMKVYFFPNEANDFAYTVLGVINIMAAIVSLITAIIIDWLNQKNSFKKRT